MVILIVQELIARECTEWVGAISTFDLHVVGAALESRARAYARFDESRELLLKIRKGSEWIILCLGVDY